MNNISVLVERGDKYGDCDVEIAEYQSNIIPRIGEIIEIDLKDRYIVDKVLYSILTKESKQFISVYVYKIEK